MDEQENELETTKVVPIRRLIAEVPGALSLALAFAGHKGSRYWFFFWGPDWLVNAGRFSPATAAYLTVALGER